MSCQLSNEVSERDEGWDGTNEKRWKTFERKEIQSLKDPELAV
jgi:hypothetical protein